MQRLARPRTRAIWLRRVGQGIPWAVLALCLAPATVAAQSSPGAGAQDLGAMLNAKVSTASRYAQTVREVAGSVSIVTAEDMRRFGYRTLTDVLQSMAGVYVARNRVDVIYVTPLRGVDLTGITVGARTWQVTTFTGVPRYVERGISLGIGIARDRPQILVNLDATRAEGSDFNSQLLRVAKVLEQ
ncbi:MAG: YfiR/HmsC family protein [Gemmatimonadota bacterium]